MSHHFNAHGQFPSDQYLFLAPDEIVLSFKDPAAMEALYTFANWTDDDALAVAIRKRLDTIVHEFDVSSTRDFTSIVCQTPSLEGVEMVTSMRAAL